MHLRQYRLAGLTALILAHGMVSASAQQARMDIGLLTCGLTKSDEAQRETGVAPVRQTRNFSVLSGRQTAVLKKSIPALCRESVWRRSCPKSAP